MADSRLQIAHNRHEGISFEMQDEFLVAKVTTGSIGAATANQGSLAQSAVQPGDNVTVLGSGSAVSGRVATADGAGKVVWQAPTGGGGSGSVNWGEIGGNIDNQTDLGGVLLTKAHDSTVVKLFGNQSVSGIKTFSGPVRVPPPLVDDDAATKKYVDDRVDTGIGGRYLVLGDVSGTTLIDMDSVPDTNVTCRAVGNIDIYPTNVPSGLAIITIEVRQDGTGNRTVTYPPNTVFLDGADGSIDPTPSDGHTYITLITNDGGNYWRAAVSDTRPTQYDPILVNPQGDGTSEFTWTHPITVDLSNVEQVGVGSVTYSLTTDGVSFSSVSGLVTVQRGMALRVTVSGIGDFLALAIPRVG